MTFPAVPDGAEATADLFDLGVLLDALSSTENAPASGSATAIVGAIASAVAAKVARVSSDPGALAQATLLTARLTALAAHDAHVFAAALRELERPRDGDSDARDFSLGLALTRAAAAPLAIAEASADVSVLAAQLARTGRPELRPDAVAAAILAAAATRAAAHLVEINLASRPGDDVVAHARAAVAGAELALAELESDTE